MMSETKNDMTNPVQRLVMCNQTREGNEIYPAGCGIRESIRGNSNSICPDCKHVADLCKDQWKRTQSVNGYAGVIECGGFEAVNT